MTSADPAPQVRLAAVVAAAENDVIGVAGDLPWHIRGDLARFKRLTLGHAVIVGSRTQRSIEARVGGPLPGRQTVLLTRGPAESRPGLSVAHTTDEAVTLAEEYSERHGRDTAFVAGGAAVYAALLPRTDVVHLTRVHATVVGDTVLPPDWLAGFTLLDSEPGTARPGEPPHTYLTYGRS